MTRPTRAVGRVPLLLLLPALLACEESTLPVIPDDEPRYTDVAIDSDNAVPSQTGSVRPGQIDYSVTAYYQMTSEWSPEATMQFYVVAYAADTIVYIEHFEELPLNDNRGTVRFTGRAPISNCGSIDEAGFFAALTHPDNGTDWIGSDSYFIPVENSSSQPCP